MKALFTQAEQFLIHNNKNFLLTCNKIDDQTNSLGIQPDDMHLQENDLKLRFNYLLSQTGIPAAYQVENEVNEQPKE